MKLIAAATLTVFGLFPVCAQDLAKDFFTKHDQHADSATSFYYAVGKKDFVAKGGFMFNAFVDTVRSYYSDTHTIKAVHYYDANGQKDGPYTEYDRNGHVAEKGVYRNHFKFGLVNGWYPNGNNHYQLEFSENVPENEFGVHAFKVINYWDSLGNHSVVNGDGWCKCILQSDFLESGVVRSGLRDSVWTGYLGDVLKFTEEYELGELKRGISYSGGEEVAYSSIRIPPEYKGGLPEMIKFIKSNMKYPKSARRLGIDGTVYVTFVVNRDATVTDVEILQGVAPMLDAEALRVVRLMDKKWIPGMERGTTVFVRFNLPLRFKLN